MYKILAGNTVIDAIETPSYVRYQTRNKRLIACDDLLAQGIISSDGSEIYQIEGRASIGNNECTSVVLVEIDAEEYEILKESVVANRPVKIEEEHVDAIEEATVAYVMNAKISEMNKECGETIVSGFDIELSDGVIYHFDLTLEDQVNILSLKDLVATGEEKIPYHCAGGLCKYFSTSDIASIINKSEEFKNYHLVYFNSLKNYIKSLKDIKEISKITYGCKIPKKYQSEVLKTLLA